MGITRDTRIEDLEFEPFNLSKRTRIVNALKNHGLYTVGDILPLSKDQLLSFRGLGVSTVYTLEKEINKGGFFLDNETDKKNAAEIYIYTLDNGGHFTYRKVKAVITYKDNNTKSVTKYIEECDNYVRTHLMPENAKIMGTTDGKIVWLDYLSVKDAAVIFTVWYEKTLSALRTEYASMKEIFSIVSDELVKMIIYSK